MQFIVIEGNIGAGKTTLATKLAKDYNAKLLLERFNSNPFLSRFYKNPAKYAFHLELSLLVERHKQIENEIPVETIANSLLIADYSITKSLIFAKNTLSEIEFEIFQHFYNTIIEKAPRPDLYVYLHSRPQKLIKNIIKRGRTYEIDISHKYLDKIEKGYLNFLKHNTEFPFLIIDINNIDFEKESENYDKLKKAIFNSEYKLGLNTLVL